MATQARHAVTQDIASMPPTTPLIQNPFGHIQDYSSVPDIRGGGQNISVQMHSAFPANANYSEKHDFQFKENPAIDNQMQSNDKPKELTRNHNAYHHENAYYTYPLHLPNSGGHQMSSQGNKSLLSPLFDIFKCCTIL